MSIEAITGISLVGMTVLGVIIGGAWWMSALYSEVHGIRESIDSLRSDNKENLDRVWNTLNNHGDRIIKLESRP